jgi:hypothetical protein
MWYTNFRDFLLLKMVAGHIGFLKIRNLRKIAIVGPRLTTKFRKDRSSGLKVIAIKKNPKFLTKKDIFKTCFQGSQSTMSPTKLKLQHS